jgi:glycosyltransferase involved in cell wall biosynthesis
VKIAMIAAALPPQLDGIGDYSARIAEELAKHCSVTVYTGDDAAHNPISGCNVVSAFTPQSPASVWQLTDKIAAEKPDWVLLQYNPFSFGRRGWNPYLASAMAAIKKRSPGTRLAVMAHETFVPLSGFVWYVMGTYQRWQFLQLGRAADLLFLSIEPWAKEFAGWFPKIPVRHLPVGSNMPRVEISREEARERLGIAPETFVVGLFGQAHISRMLDWIGDTVQSLYRDDSRILLLYIGPHADNVRAVAGDVPLIAEGPFPPEEVSRRFAAMDVYLVPFIDGVSTRRTSFMTGLLHGIPTVSTVGYHSDSVLVAEDGKAFLLSAINEREVFQNQVRRLRTETELRMRIGATGERLYRENFTYERVAEQMRQEFERLSNSVKVSVN